MKNKPVTLETNIVAGQKFPIPYINDRVNDLEKTVKDLKERIKLLENKRSMGKANAHNG